MLLETLHLLAYSSVYGHFNFVYLKFIFKVLMLSLRKFAMFEVHYTAAD
jgi:hypothetical protein